MQRGRDQHRPVEVDPVILCQQPRQARNPLAAIAFPRQRLGRAPAVVLGQPLPDEPGDTLHIAVHGIKWLGIARRAIRPQQHPAIAGSDRINENQIGEINPAVGVRLQPGRHRRERPIPRRGNGQRPDGSNMQENARPTRPAIHQKSDRAPGRIGIFLQVIDMEHLDLGPLGIGAHLQQPRLRRIGQRRIGQRRPAGGQIKARDGESRRRNQAQKCASDHSECPIPSQGRPKPKGARWQASPAAPPRYPKHEITPPARWPPCARALMLHLRCCICAIYFRKNTNRTETNKTFDIRA